MVAVLKLFQYIIIDYATISIVYPFIYMNPGEKESDGDNMKQILIVSHLRNCYKEILLECYNKIAFVD